MGISDAIDFSQSGKNGLELICRETSTKLVSIIKAILTS
ncbi:Uncharacterised protein [Mycobacteroides abscessus subsp. abscessus]|nr:Uncharacterised protein [Mycobacteroides abscessus subsp. abscessus]